MTIETKMETLVELAKCHGALQKLYDNCVLVNCEANMESTYIKLIDVQKRRIFSLEVLLMRENYGN